MLRKDLARGVWLALAILAATVLVIPSSETPAAIKFNEIYYSPETPEEGRQFIELRSTTGGVESLNNLWILEIDGDDTEPADNAGTIVSIINLNGLSTGSNGLFLWRDSPTVLDNSPAPGVQGPGSTSVLTLDLFPGRVDLGYEGDENGGIKVFENNISNFFLVEGFTGSLNLDLDNELTPSGGDGVLNLTPWTAVHDAVSVKENVDDGYQYASAFGGVDFEGTFGADIFSWDPVENMWAFYDSGSGEGNGAYVGPFYANDGGGFTGTSDAGFEDGRVINVTSSSRFLYTTPGAENVSGVGGLFRGDVDQDGDVDAADIDFLYDNLGTVGSRFDVALIPGAANQADVDALVRGDTKPHGEDLLHTEYGDADLDGDVDGHDFLAWQRGYGTDAGWAKGDFNGDDIVNQADLAIWQANFGFVRPAPLLATVPEPSAYILLAFTSLLMFSRWP